MSERQHATFECTGETFRPDQRHPVRWLDVEQDFELAREYWTIRIEREDWRQFAEEGYQYAAVVEDGRIVSLAAAWQYSDDAWMLAAVSTREDKQRQGYSRSVCSFVTAHILASVGRATCMTRSDNLPMQRTAESVGFYRTDQA